MANEIAVIQNGSIESTESRFLPVMSIQTAVRRFDEIKEYVSKVMEEGEDFGLIPGAKKPSLWKPGAEKLCNLFGIIPRYEAIGTDEDWTGERHAGEPFFYYRVRCSLWRGDCLMGEGEGSCNSWESKYRYRNSERLCPSCGKPAIIKGKAEYGGGFVCFKNKGGCGAKFADRDPAIVEQVIGKVPNPDVYDLVNTILKMANKRAQIAATLNATGASRFFTQDVEDMPQFGGGGGTPQHSEPLPPAHQPKAPDDAVKDLWSEMMRGKFECLGVMSRLKKTMIDAFGDEGDMKYREVLAKYIPQTAWDAEEKRPKATGFTDGTWASKAERFGKMQAAVKDMYEILDAEAQARAAQEAAK